jgi:dTDP-4-amino-4,6-dideoxygalactose transaminase
MGLPTATRVQELLAERTDTNPRDWYFTFKARYGMQVVFAELARSLGGGTVATQAFTCATAVDPIVVAGLTPHYCEIDLDTLAIKPPIADDYAAVVLQHTFGIVSPAAAQIAAAGGLVIEDSAHCVGRMAKDNSGRPLADISVHSFGVE